MTELIELQGLLLIALETDSHECATNQNKPMAINTTETRLTDRILNTLVGIQRADDLF